LSLVFILIREAVLSASSEYLSTGVSSAVDLMDKLKSKYKTARTLHSSTTVCRCCCYRCGHTRRQVCFHLHSI